MIPDRHRRWAILLMACLLFVLSMFYRASVAVITPDLIRDLGLDARGLSLISAAFFYAFAFMQIPISMYLDGIGSPVIHDGAVPFSRRRCLDFCLGRFSVNPGDRPNASGCGNGL